MKHITKSGNVSWGTDDPGDGFPVRPGAPAVLDGRGASFWYIPRGEDFDSLLLMVPPRGRMESSRVTKTEQRRWARRS